MTPYVQTVDVQTLEVFIWGSIVMHKGWEIFVHRVGSDLRIKEMRSQEK